MKPYRHTGVGSSPGADLVRIMVQPTADLEQAALRTGQRQLTLAWQSEGLVNQTGDTVTLSGPGLHRRRLGTRAQLADARLLWPEG
jgi:hypothetical protein